MAAYLLDEWLPSIKPRAADRARGHRETVSAATHEAYRRDLSNDVISRIGAVRLQALTPAHLDERYDDLERSGRRDGTGLKPKTVANVAGVVHRALADAVKRGRLRRSPADAVSPPSAGKASTRWWSVPELRQFLLHVRDDELSAARLLLATTGARRGEVAGLLWDDLDLDAGRVRIDWTLGHVGHRITWKPRPKARAGNRTMALDPATGWHDVKIISQRLGHANVAITLDTYSHVLPSADEAAANTLADLILGGARWLPLPIRCHGRALRMRLRRSRALDAGGPHRA